MRSAKAAWLWAGCLACSLVLHGLVLAGLGMVGRKSNHLASVPPIVTLEVARVEFGESEKGKVKSEKVGRSEEVGESEKGKVKSEKVVRREEVKREDVREAAKIEAPPRAREAIRPVYPRRSRLRGEEGDVTLEVDVAADGRVAGVRVEKTSGFAALDEAAVEAAEGAQFCPATSQGVSCSATVRLTLRFSLSSMRDGRRRE